MAKHFSMRGITFFSKEIVMKSLKMGTFILGGVLAFDLAAWVVRAQDTSTPGQSTAPTENHDSSQRGSGMSIRHAQEVLKDRGYYKADVDGKYGPETRAALEKYQRDENLTVSGRLDSDTAARLGPGKKASGTAGAPVQGAKSAAKAGYGEAKGTGTAGAPIQGAKSATKEGYSEAKETSTTAVKQQTKQAGGAVKEALGEIKGNSKKKKSTKREQ
jgi:peptidoglycan hydrolase-like protein with peptidoglycan-binding domain